jgi:uncharacterized protein
LGPHPVMFLAEIWRYPVKSMAGERLAEADLRLDGIAGDRTTLVVGADQRVRTARTWPRLLGHRATLDGHGMTRVDGRPWDDPSVAAYVEAAAGLGARLVRYGGEDRFDVLPLLVTSDGALEAFGRDRRRLRPNLVIGGVEGLAERSWEGRALRVGDARIRAVDLRGRCVMTTYDPDTLAKDPRVLRDLAERFQGTFALNTEVLHPARIREGDPVVLER